MPLLLNPHSGSLPLLRRATEWNHWLLTVSAVLVAATVFVFLL